LIGLLEERKKRGLRPLTCVAHRAPDGRIGTINDELPRSADTARKRRKWTCLRLRKKAKTDNRENAERYGRSHKDLIVLDYPNRMRAGKSSCFLSKKSGTFMHLSVSNLCNPNKS
jgi:hypothetical protein